MISREAPIQPSKAPEPTEAIEPTEATEAIEAPDEATHAAPGALARRRRVVRWTALALVVGVVALLALGWLADALGQIVPAGRSQAGAASQTHAVGFDTLALRATPAPLHAGATETLTFTLTDATGAPVAHARIQVTLTMAVMDMSGGSGLAQPTTTPGVYRLVGGFAMSGEWTLAVAVTPAGASTLHTTFTLQAQ